MGIFKQIEQQVMACQSFDAVMERAKAWPRCMVQHNELLKASFQGGAGRGQHFWEPGTNQSEIYRILLGLHRDDCDLSSFLADRSSLPIDNPHFVLIIVIYSHLLLINAGSWVALLHLPFRRLWICSRALYPYLIDSMLNRFLLQPRRG